jgi:hypothetical protein
MGDFYRDHNHRPRCPRCHHEVSPRLVHCLDCGYSPAPASRSGFDAESFGKEVENGCLFLTVALGALVLVIVGVAMGRQGQWFLLGCALVITLFLTQARRLWDFTLAPIRDEAALEWYGALPKWAQWIVWVLGLASLPLLLIGRLIELVISGLLLILVLWGTRRPVGQGPKEPEPAEAGHPMADPIDLRMADRSHVNGLPPF